MSFEETIQKFLDFTSQEMSKIRDRLNHLVERLKSYFN
jgi:uncharacterized coiled-coil protein SlyX